MIRLKMPIVVLVVGYGSKGRRPLPETSMAT